MIRLTVILIISCISTTVSAGNEEVSTSTTPQPPQPVYSPQQQSPVYVPRPSYPYADSYGSIYDGFFYPQMVQPQPVQAYQEQKSQSYPLMTTAQGALAITMRILGRVGFFIIGGTALLTLGAIFTTIICKLTSICVISFPGLQGIDRESVRSLMNPDNLSATAALLQDAIGKYQRLQRATRET